MISSWSYLLPFIHLRVILDGANTRLVPLPVSADGEVNAFQGLLFLLRHPGELPEFFALLRAARRAQEIMRAVMSALLLLAVRWQRGDEGFWYQKGGDSVGFLVDAACAGWALDGFTQRQQSASYPLGDQDIAVCFIGCFAGLNDFHLL